MNDTDLGKNWPIPVETDDKVKRLLERTQNFRTEKPRHPFKDQITEHARNATREVSKEQLLVWVQGLEDTSSHPDKQILAKLLVLVVDSLYSNAAEREPAPVLIASMLRKIGIELPGTEKSSDRAASPPRAASSTASGPAAERSGLDSHGQGGTSGSTTGRDGFRSPWRDRFI